MTGFICLVIIGTMNWYLLLKNWNSIVSSLQSKNGVLLSE